MVVKGRTPHRRACLCCAEAGTLPFSLRRANGDAALDDTWSGLAGNDDDAVPTLVTPPVGPLAEVRQQQSMAPAVCTAASMPQPCAETRGSTTAYKVPTFRVGTGAGLAVGIVCVALLFARARARSR